MRLLRAMIISASLALTLSFGACGGEGGDDAGVDTGVDQIDDITAMDTTVPDVALPDDVVPDTTALDTPGQDSQEELVPTPDTVEAPLCEGPGLMGQVVQTDGSPIGGAKLFLCGVVNGSETCNPRTADDQGFFSFQNLAPGYTHVEVNATLSGVNLGKRFAGWSLAVDPSGVDCLDMGEIVLQELPPGEEIVSADGGVIQIGAVTVEFPPGCPVFPDYSDQGNVGGASVAPADAYWAPDGAVLAVAMHPFKAHCDVGATVRVDGAEGLIAPRVMFNDLAEGGAHDAGAMTMSRDGDDWILEAAVPDLAWIWIVEQP